MPPCIAALDVGTTSVKACLFTPELELIACCVQEYALDARGAWVEERPETYLAAARDAMRAALAAAPGHRPEALGLCTQGETMVPADAQGPLSGVAGQPRRDAGRGAGEDSGPPTLL